MNAPALAGATLALPSFASAAKSTPTVGGGGGASLYTSAPAS
jgi:hypothetical protein